MAKSKKSDLTKPIKSKLIKSKKSDLLKSNFAKVDFFGMDFHIFKTKKTFIHLWKAFTKASLFKYFDSKYHIQIETNILGYIIGKVLSPIILDQCFFNYVTQKNTNLFKSKIGQ